MKNLLLKFWLWRWRRSRDRTCRLNREVACPACGADTTLSELGGCDLCDSFGCIECATQTEDVIVCGKCIGGVREDEEAART